MNKAKIYNQLSEIISSENLILYPSMGNYTSFRAGGKANLLAVVQSPEALKHALQVLSTMGEQYTVLGNGTNVLVKDSGYDGTIVKMGEPFSMVLDLGDDTLFAAGGTPLSVLAKGALAISLTGLEFAAGIPGTVGGAVFMNAGAYEGEMSQVVATAAVISKDGTRERILSLKDLKLSYRNSILQETGEVVTGVTFKLKQGNREEIAKKIKELAELRNSKQPMNLPSAGSFFKRPQGHFAGKLIQDAGLSGLSVGGAQVSTLHAGFIVNTGKATATDILTLMELIQHRVFDSFGVRLEPEVRIL